MVIAPLDHLWVLVNVYELDQDKVRVGQTMEIQFPFLEQKIQGKVQYVANEVSKDTRAVQVRATIPNPDGRLKSDMLVKAILDIPPVPGQTVIPRLAMVAINGSEYVFVRKSRPDSDAEVKEGARKRRDKFERRQDRGGPGEQRHRGRAKRPQAGRGGRHQRQPDPGAALRGPADGRHRPAPRVIPTIPGSWPPHRDRDPGGPLRRISPRSRRGI